MKNKWPLYIERLAGTKQFMPKLIKWIKKKGLEPVEK